MARLPAPLRFFFYGTLIAGSANAAARAAHGRLRAGGAASVVGALWAIPDPLGWYPALVAGSGRVQGVVYTATGGFGADDLARLDEWEDFNGDQPAESLYLRQTMPVTDASGASHLAQVYVYNQPLPADARAIAGGDFRLWLETNQFVAYAG